MDGWGDAEVVNEGVGFVPSEVVSSSDMMRENKGGGGGGGNTMNQS